MLKPPMICTFLLLLVILCSASMCLAQSVDENCVEFAQFKNRAKEMVQLLADAGIDIRFPYNRTNRHIYLRLAGIWLGNYSGINLNTREKPW